jgi:hypothetical protein
VIAGTLNRSVGMLTPAGEPEALWGRLDRSAVDGREPETIVVLAGEGEAPPGSDPDAGPSQWSPTPWKYLKLGRKGRKASLSQAPAGPRSAGGQESVGVGRMAERIAAKPKAPPPMTAWDIVSAAFRELITSAREEKLRRRAMEAAAAQEAETAAHKLSLREAMGLGPVPEPIPPLPVRKPDPLDLLAGGAPRLAIGARLARFPDGRGRNPCQEAEGIAAAADPPLDYILLDKRLTEAGGLAGFGVLPDDSAGEGTAASRHCPVFVDLHF